MSIQKHTLLFVLVPLVVVVGLVTAVLIMHGNASEGTSSSTARHTSASENSHPAQTNSTTEGTFICLPHKGDGPQTLECGMGVRTEDGTMYGLRADDDPTILSSAPMGARIRVTGVIAKEATQYDTVGTIRVEKLEQL